SGPGLNELRVIARLAGVQPAALVATFLGAHEVPPEFRDRRADYVRLVCEEMIPAVARERLAVACDVFCEPGVFSVAEARTVLAAARRHGLALKLHADELDGSGGAELAVEVGASSADHRAGISPAGIRALAASETVAVLLPATLLFLGGRSQAPARRLLDAGAALALATDLNPGSSPTLSLPLVMALAVSQLGLRHAEAVNAVTVNAAAALGMVADRGQLAPGLRAELVACDVAGWNRVGDLYLKVKDPAQAADYYDRAVDKYAELGFHNNAIAMCNKVLRNAPGRQTTYLKLAKLYAAKGFIAEAKQNFVEYAERMQKIGKIQQAFAALKEFTDISPENTQL